MKSIGCIGNYYGGLNVRHEDGKYEWSIENYDGESWEEIPKYLYEALIRFENETRRRWTMNAAGLAGDVCMRLVILESPFAGDIEANIEYGRACVRDSLLRGEAPIASHLLYTQPGILDDAVPAERQHGINAGLAWKAVAGASVVYTDRGISKGMQYGIAAAQAVGIPIEFRSIGQIAADERDDAILQMRKDGAIGHVMAHYEMCMRLYDAGYRKVEGGAK